MQLQAAQYYGTGTASAERSDAQCWICCDERGFYEKRCSKGKRDVCWEVHSEGKETQVL